jgi:hypothetical protein
MQSIHPSTTLVHSAPVYTACTPLAAGYAQTHHLQPVEQPHTSLGTCWTPYDTHAYRLAPAQTRCQAGRQARPGMHIPAGRQEQSTTARQTQPGRHAQTRTAANAAAADAAADAAAVDADATAADAAADAATTAVAAAGRQGTQAGE